MLPCTLSFSVFLLIKGTINKRVRPKVVELSTFWQKSVKHLSVSGSVAGVITLSVAEVALWLLIGLSNQKMGDKK